MSLEVAGISILAAFAAGLLSCASPCLLPLIPAYMGYLTGAALGGSGYSPSGVVPEPTPGSVPYGRSMVAATSGASSTATFITVAAPAPAMGPSQVTSSPFLHSLSFVSGFSLVFIAFGVSLGLIGFFLRDQQDIILKVSGSLLIILGLHLSGVITIPFLEQERRLELESGRKVGYARSFLVGSAFSAGWSPCIGPSLGAILSLAVTSGTVGQAGLLLTAYSLGLAIPFLAMGLAFNSIQPFYKWMKRYSGVINYLSGALLIVIGILVFTNSLINFNSLFNFGFLGDVSAEL